jgi:hypothetical protein
VNWIGGLPINHQEEIAVIRDTKQKPISLQIYHIRNVTT